MSTLKESLQNDMKEAMRNKDKELLTTIRLVTSLIKNAEIENRGAELTDEKVMELISREIKQSKESLEFAVQAGSVEKQNELNKRIEVLTAYLPAQMSEEEVEALVSRLVSENSFEGAKDKGKLMKILMPQVKGKADGKLVNEIVSNLLK